MMCSKLLEKDPLPLVSIIVPVYKVEKYLDRCLKTLIEQTYQNIEIILIDDGSPDLCPQMCEQWAQKDERIKVIHQRNAGAAEARNTGVSVAKGDYLTFVDSDDYLPENAIYALLSRMLDDQTKMAIGKHEDVWSNGKRDASFCSDMRNSVITKKELCTKLGFGKRFAVVPWAKIYKKSVFVGLQFPQLTCGEDCWLLPLLIDRCQTISIVDEIVYYYYQRENSILHQPNEQRLSDDAEANFHLANYLFHEGSIESALYWFERALDKGISVKGKNNIRRRMYQYFSKAECQKLMMQANVKIKIKWIFFCFPKLIPLLETAKRIYRRAKHS